MPHHFLSLLRSFSLLSVLLAFANFRATGTIVEDRNLWITTVITGPLLARQPEAEASQWRYVADSTSQFNADPGQRVQTTGRFGLGYALDSRWSLWAGYHFIRNYALRTHQIGDEDRAFQQLQWTDRVGEYTLLARSRLEERFVDGSHDTGLRLRQQIRASHPIHTVAPLSWIVWDEVYVHLNATDYGARRGLDQNRIFAGLGWQWSDALRSEAGYCHRFINRPSVANRVTHALAVTLALAFK